jgi:hypothetical protein
MLKLLDCALAVDGMARGSCPAPADSVRKLLSNLEASAQALELYAIKRVPRLDLATRRIAADDGARLASIVRGNKAPLARAIGPRDYSAVAAAITRLLSAWSNPRAGQLEIILHETPTLKRPSLLRRLAARIWKALLLASAGAVIPFLPIYEADHAAGASARYALLAAAIVALANDSVPVWDTIQKSMQPDS